jgi:rSAM/selenodomain-associated transferase 1
VAPPCAVAVFVKTPGCSPVKSRLAAVCGEPFATALYRRCVAATASVVRRAVGAGGLSAYWAVAEAEAVTRWHGFPVVEQGTGDLGERMGRVHTRLVARHGQAMLIGADTPQLEVPVLCEAALTLQGEAPRLVLGPAEDGGFWLVGASAALPPSDWAAVQYSRADTLARFEARMAVHAPIARTASLGDVDRVEDLAPLAAALSSLSAPTPEQAALRKWLEETPPPRVARATEEGAG